MNLIMKVSKFTRKVKKMATRTYDSQLSQQDSMMGHKLSTIIQILNQPSINLEEQKIIEKFLINNENDFSKQQLIEISQCILQKKSKIKSRIELTYVYNYVKNQKYIQFLEKFMPHDAILDLLKDLTLEKFQKNKIIFHNQEDQKKMYLILQGTVFALQDKTLTNIPDVIPTNIDTFNVFKKKFLKQVAKLHFPDSFFEDIKSRYQLQDIDQKNQISSKLKPNEYSDDLLQIIYILAFRKRLFLTEFYQDEEYFGEFSLVPFQKRFQTTISKNNSTILVISKENFNNYIYKFILKYQQNNMKQYQRFMIFQDFDQIFFFQAMPFFQQINIFYNQLIQEENRVAMHIYLIKSGEVVAFKDGKKLCHLGSDQIFGEEAMDKSNNISQFSYVVSQNGIAYQFDIQGFLQTQISDTTKTALQNIINKQHQKKNNIRLNQLDHLNSIQNVFKIYKPIQVELSRQMFDNINCKHKNRLEYIKDKNNVQKTVLNKIMNNTNNSIMEFDLNEVINQRSENQKQDKMEQREKQIISAQRMYKGRHNVFQNSQLLIQNRSFQSQNQKSNDKTFKDLPSISNKRLKSQNQDDIQSRIYHNLKRIVNPSNILDLDNSKSITNKLNLSCIKLDHISKDQSFTSLDNAAFMKQKIDYSFKKKKINQSFNKLNLNEKKNDENNSILNSLQQIKL